MTDTLRIKKDGWWVFSPYIRNREAFNTYGAMMAVANVRYTHYGQLPDEYTDSVRRATYVVYSYQTPIAWYVPCTCNGMSFIANRWVFTRECKCKFTGWTVPLVKYSATTSVHQGKVRASLINTEYAE